MYKRFENAILAACAALAIGLGFWGYLIAGSDYTPPLSHGPWPWFVPGHPIGFLEVIRCLICSIGLLRLYDLFQPGRDPWQLIVAQIAVPGVALLSAAQLFLAGVRRNLRTVLARHRINHTIVCGLGDVGMQVVQNLRAEGHNAVAIDLLEEPPHAATCEKSGVPLVQGDAKNPRVLLAAGILQAQRVVVCTGSDTENVDIALQICELAANHSRLVRRRLRVYLELRSHWMFARLTATTGRALGSDNVDVRFFNPFSDAARMLIKRLRLPPAPEFSAQTFMLLGFGRYGREIAMHLARACPVAAGSHLRLLVVDRQAETLRGALHANQPALAAACELDFLTADIAPDSPDGAQALEDRLAAAHPLLGVCVALNSDEASLYAALQIRAMLDRIGSLTVPVYVRLEHYRKLGELISTIEGISRIRDRVHIFGTLEETLSPLVLFGEELDKVAQAFHRDYRRRSPGDINPLADVDWNKLPEYMKMSNRWRADHTPVLLALTGIHLNAGASATRLELTAGEIEQLARLEHRRYSIERGMIGIRNREDTTDGAFAAQLDSWDTLDENERAWNRREAARIPAIFAAADIQLRREQLIRLYGVHLEDAAAQLSRLNSADHSTSPTIIVDLDDPDAVRLANEALSVPGIAVWLFSRNEPREFFRRKRALEHDPLRPLIDRAQGWVRRDAVALLNAAPLPTELSQSS